MPDIVNYKEECPGCHRKILVTAVLSGSNHNIAVRAYCGVCLTIDPEYKKQHPDEAAEIEDWLKTP